MTQSHGMTELHSFVQEGKEAQKLFNHGLSVGALQGLNSLRKGDRIVIRLRIGHGEDDAFKLREYFAEVIELKPNDQVAVKTVGTIINGFEETDKIITDGPERKLILRVALDGTIMSTPVARPDLSRFDIRLGERIPRPAIRLESRLCGYIMRKQANRLDREASKLAKAA